MTLCIADHTRKYLRQEITFPGPAIDRANRDRWEKSGALTLRQRAAREVARLVERYTPSRLPDGPKSELTRLMEREARLCGMPAPPVSVR
jgi:trimethylamine:corrinoid methyltransferase-like protein